MNMIGTIEEEFREEAGNETKKIQPSAIDCMTHDIVNRLSVIILCCCELRSSVAGKLESDQLNEFKRIEVALHGVAQMIHQLKALAQDTALRVTLEDWHRP